MTTMILIKQLHLGNISVQIYFIDKMKGERGVMRPDRSPKREAINTELDDHSTRIKEMLKKDVQML